MRTSASFTSSVTVFGFAVVGLADEAEAATTARIRSNERTCELNPLDDHRNPLPAADARGSQPVALLAAAQLVQDREHETRAGRAERMAERDRAAVDVELLHVEVELFRNGKDLPGKGLVDLDEVDVLELHPRAPQRDLRRRN